MNKCNVLNRTIFLHDNLEVLQGLNSDCIDLIYLDPPFNKNKKFTAPIGSSAEGAEFSDIFREEDVKDEWLKTIKTDQEELYQYLNGVRGVGKPYNFAYLVYMAIRLIECHRVLKPTGSIYLHCDPTMSHYLKTTMDCIFGEGNFRNEIVWRIGWVSGFKTQKRGWIRNHEIILYYTKSEQANQLFNKKYILYPPDYVRRDGSKPTGKGKPIEDTWNCHTADRLDSIMIKSFSAEKTGYPTQKPLALLKRIIEASSNKEDVVLDPFCGCATTCIAAENAGRKWIGVDASVKAYELVKQRLDAEVARPHELPTERQEVYLKTDPPERNDIGASVRETRHVYIIFHPMFPEYYKVGVAKNVQARLNSYQTSDPHRSYQLEFAHETHLPFETEAHVHKFFDNKYEWVKADLADIKREIQTYAGE